MVSTTGNISPCLHPLPYLSAASHVSQLYRVLMFNAAIYSSFSYSSTLKYFSSSVSSFTILSIPPAMPLSITRSQCANWLPKRLCATIASRCGSSSLFQASLIITAASLGICNVTSFLRYYHCKQFRFLRLLMLFPYCMCFE